MAQERKLLGEYLVGKGVISEEQLKEALEEHKRTNRKIGEVLVARGIAKEEDIAHALSEQWGVNFVDLTSISQVKPETLGLIPKEICKRHQLFPLFREKDYLIVAMVNPLDVGVVDELIRLSGGLHIRPLLATPSAITKAIAQYYEKRTSDVGPEPSASEDLMPPKDKESKTEEESLRLAREAVQAPVIKLVNRLIEEAVKSGASDIHLEPQQDAFYCRFRIDGVLYEVKAPPRELQLAVVSRIKIMSQMDIAQSRLPQDGRIQTKVLGRDIDLRVATFPTIYGEHVSIRILDKTQGVIKLGDLGFQPEIMARFEEVIYKPYGMILVTGPTGSGKTTTLYAVLNTINNLTKNIITLEDPVEYTIPRIHQSQVNVRAGLTFASGLRSIVRLDPDIIMIGEIRDRETADIAIHASLTGHLVFSTLHTNDAPSAVARLTNIGVEPYLAASSLIGVLAQRLVRKLCLKCKQKYKPNKDEMSLVNSCLSFEFKMAEEDFYKPAGCPDCHDTGYKGRTGIFEFLVPDNGIKELIAKKASADQIKNAAQKAEMRTLRQDGIEKVCHGITSLSEVLSVTSEE